MFKNSYCRGIQLALIQSGRASYADGGDAIKVADYVAERVDFDPLKGVSADVTTKIANHLLEASAHLQKNQPNFKAASFSKVDTWEQVQKLASDNAINLMELAQKTAEGSTIEGGDKGNKETESPHGEAKMDTTARPPETYATNSRGETEVDTRPGAVGKEEENPKAPHETDKKDNSVQDQSRTASLADIMKKIAEGSTIQGGDKGNKQTDSTHAESKMDAAWRPEGYATFGMKGVGSLGELMSQSKGPAIVGRETPQPRKPGESPSGANSLTEHSGKAASVEDPYLTLFKKTASEVIEYIPQQYGEEQKIAHVRACMGLTVQEKAAYLQGLQREAAEKTASTPAQVPPGSRTDGYANHTPEASHSRPGAYDGRKGNQAKAAEDMGLPAFMKKDEGEKKEEKKDDDGEKKDLPPWMKSKDDGDKKDDGEKEKEAAMREHLQRLTAAMAAGAGR